MGLEVTWKNKKVIITDWTLDDDYLEVTEAKWGHSNKPLSEKQIEDLTKDQYLQIHKEAYIDQASGRFDRAKDFRKYGE